jgi:hypothetical protein
MSEEYKVILEKTIWTFVEAFIGALTVAPLVGVDAKEFAKKKISK